jgi:hypothetical protein
MHRLSTANTLQFLILEDRPIHVFRQREKSSLFKTTFLKEMSGG